MTDVAALEARLEELSVKVKALEDQRALADLIARYGPSVDTGSAQETANLWTEDGVFDVLDLMRLDGREEIAGMVNGDGHQGLIANGVAHVLTTPYFVVDGDEARGCCYALNIRFEKEADRFYVARASAVSWTLRRVGEGWLITNRTVGNLDGSDGPKDLLRALFESPANQEGTATRDLGRAG